MLFSNITEGSFDVTTSKAGTATETFFDNLYSYPPKFTIKWDALDELNEDLLMMEFRDMNLGTLPRKNIMPRGSSSARRKRLCKRFRVYSQLPSGQTGVC